MFKRRNSGEANSLNRVVGYDRIIAMQRLRGKTTLRSWASLALLAMIAVFSSPALAFACCCHPVSATRSHATHATAAHEHGSPVTLLDSDGCCDGDDGATALTSALTTSSLTVEPTVHAAHTQVEHAYDEHAHTAPQASPRGISCLSASCHCAHSTPTAMVVADTQNSSAFSPLVLGTVPAHFTPSVSSDERIALFFASRALRPRAPDGASRSGRAPPAFSL